MQRVLFARYLEGGIRRHAWVREMSVRLGVLLFICVFVLLDLWLLRLIVSG
jgi:hypothetical protein